MPDPTRPVAGAPIDTDWGQQVHDRTFQPKGVRAHQAVGGHSSVGSTYEQLGVDTADDDPGGWLGSDELEAPTGSGGLYSYAIRINAAGSDDEAARVQIRLNGAEYVSVRFATESSVNVEQIAGLIEITAGDVLQIWGRASAATDLRVTQFDLVIVGTSIGA